MIPQNNIFSNKLKYFGYKAFSKDGRGKLFWGFVLVLVGVLLFLGGLGFDRTFSLGQTLVRVEVLKTGGVLIATLLVGLALVWKGKLKLPPGSFLYGFFLLLFLLNTLIWSRDERKTLEIFALFLGGGLFWVTFYNLSSEFRPWFGKLVIALGLVFGGLFIFSHYFTEAPVGPWSLYLPSTASLNHNHIGDLWAVVLVIASYYIIKRKRWHWLLVGLGTYFLAMSQSRSAYLALLVGVLYLFWNQKWIGRYRKTFIIFVFLSLALFLPVSVQKTTLFSRPYFLQGILGFIHNPMGVGVGNFGVISNAAENQFLGIKGSFSSVAHNIILETMAGMGIFGIVFIIWLAWVIESITKEKSLSSLVYRAVFFSILTNFLFDYTYFIPTMLWIWFGSLGLAQNRQE